MNLRRRPELVLVGGPRWFHGSLRCLQTRDWVSAFGWVLGGQVRANQVTPVALVIGGVAAAKSIQARAEYLCTKRAEAGDKRD